MIEDKKDGIKIAENPKEAKWEEVRKTSEKRLTELEVALELEKVVLERAKKEIIG